MLAPGYLIVNQLCRVNAYGKVVTYITIVIYITKETRENVRYKKRYTFSLAYDFKYTSFSQCYFIFAFFAKPAFLSNFL